MTPEQNMNINYDEKYEKPREKDVAVNQNPL